MTAPAAVEPDPGLFGSWWGSARPVTRVVVVLLGIVLVVNVLGAGLGAVVGGEPGGPSGSSYATAGDGVAAWSDLLVVRGVAVDALRDPLGEATVDPDATLLVVEPEDAPGPAALGTLASHLEAGGRVVLVGRSGADYASALVGIDLGWTSDGSTAPPAGPGGRLAGLDDLQGEGRGALLHAAPLSVEAGADDRAVVASAGGLTVVADPSLLWNRTLADGDNAALALTLAGPGPVVFAEAEHGFGRASGLSAVPGRWRLALAGAVVAVLLGFWSYGPRLGPAEVADRRLPPPRHAYVEAVGAALARQPAAATSPARPSRPRPSPASPSPPQEDP